MRHFLLIFFAEDAVKVYLPSQKTEKIQAPKIRMRRVFFLLLIVNLKEIKLMFLHCLLDLV